MIEIFSGESEYAASSLMYKAIERELEKNREVYVITPEQYTLQTDIDIMQALNLQTMINVRVLSFNKLAQEVSEFTSSANIFINRAGQAMLVRSILRDLSGELKFYGNVSQNGDFLNNLISFIGELKRSAITPSEIINIKSDDSGFTDKLHEIALIWEEYEKKSSKFYMDDEDLMSFAYKNLKKYDEIKNKTVYFRGFYGFTKKEKYIIDALFQIVERAGFAFITPKKNCRYINKVFLSVINNLSDVRYLAEKNNHEVNIVEDKEKICLNSELAECADAFFLNRRVAETDISNSLFISERENPEEEVNFVARKILSIIQDKRTRFRNCAVIVTDKDIYFKLIKRIFTYYDIPVFIDTKIELISAPVMRFVLSALNIAAYKYQKTDIFNYLKSGFADVNRSSVEIFENFVVSHKMCGAMILNKKYFKNRVKEKEAEPVEQIRQFLEDEFSTFVKATDGVQKVSEFIEKLLTFLKSKKLFEKTKIFSEELLSAKMPDYAAFSSQIPDVLIYVLTQMSSMIGDYKCNLKEFTDILRDGMKEQKIGIIPPSQDQVVIGTIDRSRINNYDYMFILGCMDGYLPKIQKNNSIITEEERYLMQENGFKDISSLSEYWVEQRMNLFAKITGVKKALYLSYSLAGEDGFKFEKSMYIDKIISAYKIPLNKQSDDKAEDIVYGINPTFNLLSRKIGKGEFDALTSELINYFKKNYPERVANILKIKDKMDEPFKDAAKLYSLPSEIGVSELESFASCPFKHFVRYGIRPEERKIYEVAPTDVGLLMHDAIDLFTDKLKVLNINDITDKEIELWINEIFDVEIKNIFETEISETYRNRYIINQVKNDAFITSKEIVSQIKSGEFKLWKNEAVFGRGGDFPAVKLSENISLKGRIDRVDILRKEDKEYIKIIDYKTAIKELDLSDVWQGLSLQLITYMYAVLQSKPIYTPAGIFYFPAHKPSINTDDKENITSLIQKEFTMNGLVLDNAEILNAIGQYKGSGKSIIKIKNGELNKLNEIQFNNLIKCVMNKISDISKSISNGERKIEPIFENTDSTGCKFCRYASVCKFDDRIENKYSIKEKIKEERILQFLKESEKYE